MDNKRDIFCLSRVRVVRGGISRDPVRVQIGGSTVKGALVCVWFWRVEFPPLLIEE